MTVMHANANRIEKYMFATTVFWGGIEIFLNVKRVALSNGEKC